LKMEQIDGSETSSFKNSDAGDTPKSLLTKYSFLYLIFHSFFSK
jgi:hypothetical protein